MRRLGLFVFLCMFLCTEVCAERKKVGLVLSGGGAKGISHIGVLKVLEKAGIPVDYIVGTSMGAIVGGLHAIGYDAKTLDSLVREQDWMFLLSDKVRRRDQAFPGKEYTEKYLLSFPFEKERVRRMPSGFVSGQNIYNLFTDLTVGYHDSLDFYRFPIPFACVAANITDRSEVVLRSGNLVQAMRASMAIPGAFTPVNLDGMVLVDGGVVNNYPADVAKAMGADIIIGVDLQSNLVSLDKLNSLQGIVGQLVHFLCMNKHEENVKQTDLLIKPDVEKYSVAGFTPNAIDSLLRIGEEAANLHWEKLLELKKQIGVVEEEPLQDSVQKILRDTFFVKHIYMKGISGQDEEWVRRRIKLKEHSRMTISDLHRAVSLLYGTKAYMGVTYRLLNGPEYDLELTLKENSMGTFDLGFRFDSEEMAAILLNMTLNRNALHGSKLSLTSRLSQSPYIRIDYSFEKTFLRRLNLAYMFRYNDFNIYERGDKINNTAYSNQLIELGLSDIYFRNFKLQCGLRYEYYDYDAFEFLSDNRHMNVRKKGFISYYGLAHLETFDKRYYPTRGISFKAEYSLYTDNFAKYNNHSPFSTLSAAFSGVISLTNRFKMIPSIAGRVLIGPDVAFPFLNYVGGEMAGRYVPQQLPFLGIGHVEIFDNAVVMAKLKFRQRMGAKHYVSFMADYALQDNNFFDLLGGEVVWGGGAGYSYDTIIGPVDFVVSLSDRSKKPEFYFNLGYYF